MRINIAIDGPSASGKSTLAREICKRLNYIHLDTGAMYRCAALYAKNTQTNINDEKQLMQMLETLKIDFTEDGKVILNGEDVTEAIRTDEVSMASSDISTKKIVREKLVEIQQKMAEDKGFVMDGRDIGTVVLPDAEVKIYLTASASARAMRRFLENQKRGIESNLMTLKNEIVDRDYQDMHRKHSPLRQAEDAILIDSSDMTITEVVDEVMRIISEKI
ncbi:MAG TPA: (d)CMP kinase [Erysipelotrichaceae bacterium]|jgi:cytidylate kinase|nr:(d)CMP kinase [Erysipelotrichia bacterium]HPX32811.1 (d)CMP kinase [Erysipelotrichaceae bacterium]HQA85440.1 (d)CMP kinase [Erysipelotrichaceae bacterium]